MSCQRNQHSGLAGVFTGPGYDPLFASLHGKFGVGGQQELTIYNFDFYSSAALVATFDSTLADAGLDQFHLPDDMSFERVIVHNVTGAQPNGNSTSRTSAAAMPEPTSIALIGLALGAFALSRNAAQPNPWRRNNNGNARSTAAALS